MRTMRPGPAVPGRNQDLLSVPSELPMLLSLRYGGACPRPIQAELWFAVIRARVHGCFAPLYYGTV